MKEATHRNLSEISLIRRFRSGLPLFFFLVVLLTFHAARAEESIDFTAEEWARILETDRPADPRPVPDSSLPLPFFRVEDQPDDSGGEILIHTWWGRDEDTPPDFATVENLEKNLDRVMIRRAYVNADGTPPAEEAYETLEAIPIGSASIGVDQTGERTAVYRLRAWKNHRFHDSAPSEPIRARASWFNWGRFNLLLASLLVAGLILGFIRLAGKGKPLFIRRISGLDAIDEAIGRATEMGRKILYVPGIMDVDDPQTIAGLNILSHVSRYAAEYQTEMDVPVSRAMVMVAGREVVREAFLSAGRPQDYQERSVHYVTDDQFGFAAAVDGHILRERPAAIFFQGTFYAESLILAETGHSVDAIQIAGTAMVTQLPFFITACDYTLIGEELFAASAYLSREPRMLGSLKGQDYAKLAALVAIVLSVLAATAGEVFVHPEWAAWMRELFHVAG